MVQYSGIRFWDSGRSDTDDAAKVRVIEKLLALRKKLYSDITRKRSKGAFLLATWNLRDFDSNKFGHGFRLEESYYYLAEIISTFDLVALQEINRDLRGLKKLMKLLGSQWDYICTDTTEGSGGNGERMAYVFNRNTIRFDNIAGEVVLPERQKILRNAGEDNEAELQFARTPFVAAFQAGWYKFNLCSVHIYFGDDSGAKLQRRIDEIDAIAKFFEKRQDKEKGDYILLGDFNIVDPDDPTMVPLIKHKFTLPEELMDKKSNLKGNKHYDQIALRCKNKMLEIDNAGVFDFEDIVFSDSDVEAYTPFCPADKIAGKTPDEVKDYYRGVWRTFQISDHKPMWVELKVDFTNDYLESLKPEEKPLADFDPEEETS